MRSSLEPLDLTIKLAISQDPLVFLCLTIKVGISPVPLHLTSRPDTPLVLPVLTIQVDIPLVPLDLNPTVIVSLVPLGLIAMAVILRIDLLVVLGLFSPLTAPAFSSIKAATRVVVASA